MVNWKLGDGTTSKQAARIFLWASYHKDNDEEMEPPIKCMVLSLEDDIPKADDVSFFSTSGKLNQGDPYIVEHECIAEVAYVLLMVANSGDAFPKRANAAYYFVIIPLRSDKR